MVEVPEQPKEDSAAGVCDDCRAALDDQPLKRGTKSKRLYRLCPCGYVKYYTAKEVPKPEAAAAPTKAEPAADTPGTPPEVAAKLPDAPAPPEAAAANAPAANVAAGSDGRGSSVSGGGGGGGALKVVAEPVPEAAPKPAPAPEAAPAKAKAAPEPDPAPDEPDDDPQPPPPVMSKHALTQRLRTRAAPSRVEREERGEVEEPKAKPKEEGKLPIIFAIVMGTLAVGAAWLAQKGGYKADEQERVNRR